MSTTITVQAQISAKRQEKERKNKGARNRSSPDNDTLQLSWFQQAADVITKCFKNCASWRCVIDTCLGFGNRCFGQGNQPDRPPSGCENKQLAWIKCAWLPFRGNRLFWPENLTRFGLARLHWPRLVPSRPRLLSTTLTGGVSWSSTADLGAENSIFAVFIGKWNNFLGQLFNGAKMLYRTQPALWSCKTVWSQ